MHLEPRQGDLMSAMTDASTMILADDVEAVDPSSGLWRFDFRGDCGLLHLDRLWTRLRRPARPLRGARGLVEHLAKAAQGVVDVREDWTTSTGETWRDDDTGDSPGRTIFLSLHAKS
eukprot:s3237_g6.t1